MADPAQASHFLLGCFAEFYEEVASIKLANEQGRLPGYLAVGDEPPPTRGVDLAARVSARLMEVLGRQTRRVRENGSDADGRAYAIAQYVMAALADEIFILELDWPGREPWLHVMLEYKLFRTHNAGRRFFELANKLLQTRAGTRNLLHVDLAAVFLLALQLGFKGQYRGRHWDAALKALRQKLHRFVEGRSQERDDGHLFWQAYEHTQRGEDKRLAPLRPWLIALAIAAGIYLVASKALWFWSLQPIEALLQQKSEQRTDR
ncbi:DotU family type IV/VI secretion system protein [Chitinolyticbacter meiyuanensis]|uniref:DotU family type IV/VI secretion system protein n=1 Tax=Chitinolyticbacter meiyuanensis TaxID=682798 RepID=UPI0011E5EB29|nr:DotU family type IV/VI secretion system protein [Chitinolyticbacter meiyuanensis]